MSGAFTSPAEAAFAVLMAFRDGKLPLTRKAGAFTGETLVDNTPLSEKQAVWLQGLLAKAGLPPLQIDEGNGPSSGSWSS